MASPIAALLSHMAEAKKGKPSSSSVVIEASSKPKVMSSDGGDDYEAEAGSADKYAEKVFEAIKADDLESFKKALRLYMDACESEEPEGV